MKQFLATALAALLVAGCSIFGGSRIESASWYHMRLADSLEQRKSFREAARHYESVAELYPQSTAYPAAVRRVALLYASDFNESRNDSIALYWLAIYVGMPIKKAEREDVQTVISLLRRTKALRDDLAHRTALADSLMLVNRRQASIIGSESRRLQDLEAELAQTQKELTKIRDIDLRLSKSRERK
jgi:hypothetical protein